MKRTTEIIENAHKIELRELYDALLNFGGEIKFVTEQNDGFVSDDEAPCVIIDDGSAVHDVKVISAHITYEYPTVELLVEDRLFGGEFTINAALCAAGQVSQITSAIPGWEESEIVLDKAGKEIRKGDMVMWFDPEGLTSDYYEVFDEPTTDMVKLSSDFGECEALPLECLVIESKEH